MDIASRTLSIDLRLATLAVTLLPLSLLWDYSWESTVGVDQTWAPPHLATHIAVWLLGLIGLKQLIATTREGAGGVSIGKLRAPSGVWLMLWAVLAFQVAFLFDTWWQRAYGLGAGIWHPPQILKAIAFVGMQFGVLVFCAAPGAGGRRSNFLIAWNVVMLLVLAALMMGAATLANAQHAAAFYKLSSFCFPFLLVLGATATGLRWGATFCAFGYLLAAGAMTWILPLFPARPLTGPIHNPMDHFLPPTFPLLLVIPAVIIDGLRAMLVRPQPRRGNELDDAHCVSEPSRLTPSPRPSSPRGRWSLISVVISPVFLALFIPSQWMFAKFLLSPAADNWFFAGGGKHWPFFLKIDEARVMFWRASQDPLNLKAMLICLALATASSWVGIGVGNWLCRLRR